MQKKKDNHETEFDYFQDPYKVKHNSKHSRQYIYDWIFLGIVIVGAIVGIYFWVNS